VSPVLPTQRPADEPEAQPDPERAVTGAPTATTTIAGVTVGDDGLALADVPPVESQLARDMVRHGLIVAPALLLICGAVWGWVGVSSCAYGLALVFANFLLAAGMLGWAARFGSSALLATALGGFLLRMLLLVLAIAVVKDQTWIDMAPLGATILVTYLGLLFWETRYVSASLAFPGLKPRTKGA
jgi:hypothetical protein